MMPTTLRRRLPDHVAEAMTAILDYLWQDEVRDYLAQSHAGQRDLVNGVLGLLIQGGQSPERAEAYVRRNLNVPPRKD